MTMSHVRPRCPAAPRHYVQLDQSGVALGADLYGLANNGDWSGLNNANGVYSAYTGFGPSSTSSQSGGGWQGALGGALGGATLGRNMGWW